NNTLGGSTAAERNILSGNSAYGVFIYNMGTRSNVVIGNYVGTDVSGTTAVPNAVGIVVDGAAFKHRIESNIISGNLQQGIYINITGSDSTSIIKNKIGVNATSNPLGNGSDGIRISQGPKYSLIGGSPTEANTIAHNGGNGVYIMFPNDDKHLISCNSIYSNGGLGIDLFPLGVNPNDAGDADSGPNEELNYPEIDTVIFVAGSNTTIISGTLDTQNPSSVSIQIYRAIPDLSGHGQGIEYLSTVTPDAAGNWSDTLSGLTITDFLTTIAIDVNNNTSEFSIARNMNAIASVADNALSNGILIYPNPTDGTFTVSGNGMRQIDVLNSNGQLVKTIRASSNRTRVDISDQSEGIYFIRTYTQNGVANSKVVLN
nr:T9SS type A sorting domain-containing protein [Flavobacteriales bacterium]